MKAIIILGVIALAMALLMPCVAAADRDCPDYCAAGLQYSRGTYDARTGICEYASRTSCDNGCDARGTTCAAAPAATVTTAERSCPDYCSDRVAYSRGTYNSRTSSCDYASRSTCGSGCDPRGSTCAAAPTVTTTAETRQSCPDTCAGGVHSFNGAWSSIMQQCTYMTRSCVNGCDGSGTTCARDPAGCPDYCRDGVRHFNGTWNEWAQQCDYGYREECLSGCDARGTGCTGTVTGQTVTETERFITCPSNCSCITRQGGADRWPGGARMCSNSPCGRESDGTYQYCIQPATQATAQQTAAPTERFITCPSGCSCISRQGAVDRWQGAVRMCSNSPCGRDADGTTLYCIQPTDQKTAGIQQQYSGQSGTVTAVNPAFEGDQLVFVVSRERQVMLLGFIPVRMAVNTRLNGTDLAVIREDQPWWGVLVSGDATPASAAATLTQTPAPPPLLSEAASNCTNALWNEKCYDSAYDLDKDCHMTKDAAQSVCGNKIKSESGDAAFQEWLAVYPWDCDDKDPAVWTCGGIPANTTCTDTDGKNIFLTGSVTGLDLTGTKTVTVSDYCANTSGGAQTQSGQWVVEERCGPDGHVQAYYYKCPDCYLCSGGQCILQFVTGCEAACSNQSWNMKCYDSAHDLDHDCHMTKDAALSVCGNKIKSESGDAAFQEWLASYPWDCNDSDPLQCGFSIACSGVVCPITCDGSTLLSEGKCNDLTGKCDYSVAIPASPSCKK